MKTTELRTKSEVDLKKYLSKLESQLAELSRERYLKDKKNVRQIRKIKKDRARTLGLITEFSKRSK